MPTRRASPAKEEPVAEIKFDGERQLAKKLAYVMGQVGFIEKKGFNAHFKYNFVREADLKAHIAPLLSALNVFLLADVVKHELVGDTTILTVRWTFHDGDTGEHFSGTSVGYGADRGDKGANKAMTAALKFFLIPTFLVISGDDAEADITTDQRAQRMPEGEANVTSSSAQQPRRGGHSEDATNIQVQRISRLSQDLDLGSEGIVKVVEKVLGVEIPLPEGEKSAKAGALARALLAMKADDLGKVVTALREQVEAINASSKEEDDELPDIPDRSAEDEGVVGIGY